MASIKRFHEENCSGESCGCPWRLDYRPMGMRGPRRRIEFPTKKAAERFLAETSHKVARGEYVAPSQVPDFKDAAEEWVRSKLDRRPSYAADLRSRVDKYLLPAFGMLRLDQISVAAIERLRDEMRRAGRATRTIKGVMQILDSIFKMAIRHGTCGANPMMRVERLHDAACELKSKNSGEEASEDLASLDLILNPREIGQLLASAQAGLYQTLLTTLALTGMRSGEAFALRWSDCELNETPKIYVRRTLSWARLKGEEIRPRFFPPKTKAGLRTIGIAPELASILKRWKLACPPSDGDLVFPTPGGGPVRRSVALRRGLWPALSRAGLRRVNMKSLRHSYASALIAQGSPVTEVQSILGHSSPTVTLSIYSHWFRATRTTATDVVARTILCKTPKGGQKVGTEIQPGEPADVEPSVSNVA